MVAVSRWAQYVDRMTIWPMIMALHGVSEREDFHPERDQLNHTVQVTLLAERESDDVRLWAAAALHDVGKVETQRERGDSHGHEAVSASMIAPYVHPDVVWLVEQHIRVAAYLSGEMRSTKARALAEHPCFPLLIQLRRCDVAGRRPGFALTEARRERFARICTRAGLEVGAWI